MQKPTYRIRPHNSSVEVRVMTTVITITKKQADTAKAAAMRVRESRERKASGPKRNQRTNASAVRSRRRAGRATDNFLYNLS